MRRASLALIVAGACAVLDGAFPLSCAESLPGTCRLSYGVVDVVHIAETLLAIAATIAAFALLAAGLIAEADPRLLRLGYATALAGILWILCNALIGGSYLVDAFADVRGIFHRGSQVVLGLWLILFALGTAPSAATASAPGGRKRRA